MYEFLRVKSVLKVRMKLTIIVTKKSGFVQKHEKRVNSVNIINKSGPTMYEFDYWLFFKVKQKKTLLEVRVVEEVKFFKMRYIMNKSLRFWKISSTF